MSGDLHAIGLDVESNEIRLLRLMRRRRLILELPVAAQTGFSGAC